MQMNKNILLDQIPQLCMSLGIIKSFYQDGKMIVSHMPISSDPYKITQQTYNKLKKLLKLWQKLFVKIGNNNQFISQLSQKFIKGDKYCQNLYQIYKKIGPPQIGMAISRIDYIGDQSPKLVQYNLMSVGLNGISDKLQKLSGMICHSQGCTNQACLKTNTQQNLCNAVTKCLQIKNFKNGLILMVVHGNQFNYGDQACFKVEMLRRGRFVIPVTMQYLIQKMQYDQKTKQAYIDNQHIDLFYFRTGYKQQHFPTEGHWKIREQIQQSDAIKIPSIQTLLLNSKRFQAQLSKRSVLQMFLTQQQTQKLLDVIGQIYDFDNKTEQQINTLQNLCRQGNYILKPNRQGGGNNYFGKDAYNKMKQIRYGKGEQKLQNYILMKKIQSNPFSTNFVLPNKGYKFVQFCTSQFSTFGAYVYQGDNILFNQFGGNISRIKRFQDNQGGIAINMSVLSGYCVNTSY